MKKLIMGNISWQIWALIAIAVLSVIVAIFYDKKTSSKKIGETANSIFSMLLSSLWLPLWVFVQWIVGKILNTITVDAIDQKFMDIFRYLFGIVTLIFVLIEVVRDIIVAIKAAKKRIQEQ